MKQVNLKITIGLLTSLLSLQVLGQSKIGGGTEEFLMPIEGNLDFEYLENEFAFILRADGQVPEHQSPYYEICDVERDSNENTYVLGSRRKCRIVKVNEPIFDITLGPKLINFNGILIEFDLNKMGEEIFLKRKIVYGLPKDTSLAVSMAPTEENLEKLVRAYYAGSYNQLLEGGWSSYSDSMRRSLELHKNQGRLLYYFVEQNRKGESLNGLLSGPNNVNSGIKSSYHLSLYGSNWYVVGLFHINPYVQDFSGQTTEFLLPPGEYMFQKCEPEGDLNKCGRFTPFKVK